MACPIVTTGSGFLVQTLAHLDCQAETLGSFGFQSLAAPGSAAATLLTELLTLFVALYGVRLLFGPIEDPRDLVNAVLKVGIVLTLALSWPAWRILAYETVLHGPAEVAASITPSTLPDAHTGFSQRLQAVDNAMASFTVLGTGRQTGKLIDENQTGGFRSVALEDEAGLGWSRTIYLASTIGSLAMLRITGGLLLALAPLLAGLLLFDATRGLFAGWLRALAFVALGSLGLTVLLSVQVAMLDPMLTDILNRRTLGYATPTAPTELLALVMAFAVAIVGLMAVFAKIAFQNVWSTSRPAIAHLINATTSRQPELLPVSAAGGTIVQSRVFAISESIATAVRRESLQSETVDRMRRIEMDRGMGSLTPMTMDALAAAQPLGSGYRRSSRRNMQSHERRDKRT